MTEATAALRAARDQLLALAGQPERAVAEFRWPDVGPVFSWAVDWFAEVARGSHRPALVVLGEGGRREQLTYDELRVRADRAAAWLAQRGVRRGDPVVLVLGNQVELWEAMLALFALGAVVVPTTTAVGAAGLRDRVTRSGARHVLCDAADAPRAAEALDGAPGVGRLAVGAVAAEHGAWHDLREARSAPADPPGHPGTAADDPLLLYFTSGTTAQPKLVQHSQVSYPVGHLTTMHWLGLRPGDVHLNLSSPGWGKHAWSSFFAPFLAEATVVALAHRRFDAASLLAALRTEGVTTFCAPPTVWRMLIRADLGERPASLREATSAGEPLNPEVVARVRRAWGITVRDGFGQTETTASIGNAPGADVVPGAVGRPLPGVPVVVVDPATGRPVPAGQRGEGEVCLDLAAAPLSLMTGYRRPDGSTDPVGEGGLYRSGDLVSVDEAGRITYVGREDDVFKASDYKISPFEVESVLVQHPAVADAAVVPAPDAVRLAVPKACVALAPGHEPTRETARSILAHAREHLAPWQRVRRLEFVDLPTTLSGKIRRVQLRQAEAARGDGRAPGEWRDEDFDDLPGAPR